MTKDETKKIKAQIDKAKLVGYDLQREAGRIQQASQALNQQFAQNEQKIAQLEIKLKE